MEVISILGFATGQLAFHINSLPEIVQKGRDVFNWRNILIEHYIKYTALQSQYRTWQYSWGKPVTYYRAIWGDNYSTILTTKESIRKRDEEIESIWKGYIKDRDASERESKSWFGKIRRSPSKGKLSWGRKLAIALNGNIRLRLAIQQIENSIKSIITISEEEFKTRLGVTENINVNAAETDRLARLISIHTPFTERAKAIYEARSIGQIAQQTNAWALKLLEPGDFANVAEWDLWDSVQVQFVFREYPPQPNGTRMSLSVDYQPNRPVTLDGERDDIDVDWEQVICGNGVPHQNAHKEQWPEAQRQCLSFGDLFLSGFFEEEAKYKAWEPDRTRLMRGLVNWALLLWGTGWTSHLCSLGLRSVYKMCDFGILLAEVITATRIRRRTGDAPGYEYEIQHRDRPDWEGIDRPGILRRVLKKSRSQELRCAVEYCLYNDAPEGSFEVGHLSLYIEKLYKPIQKWCKDEEDHPFDLPLESWAGDALEDGRPQVGRSPGGRVEIGLLVSVTGALIAIAVAVLWSRGVLPVTPLPDYERVGMSLLPDQKLIGI
ncbi:hypothetical protein F4678DRAFT_462214 [Xylaria arbuscula]|nr:hypothetical protein F4678DRAFT_462214 [Xylaria arbuscula]